MDNTQRKLYIPYGVVSETELFNGFTTTQLKKSIKGFVLSIILSAIVFVVFGKIESTALILIVGIISSIIVNIKYDNNYSFAETIQLLMRFGKEQQNYRYVYRHFDR